MATINVFKRKDLKAPTWQYDIRHEGKRHRKSGFATKKEAQHAAQQLANKLGDGFNLDTQMTFKAYFLSWLDANNKHLLSKGQYEWYERSLNMFVERFGEDKMLSSITRQDMQLLLNKYGEGKTKESVRKVYGCLVPALRDAVYEGLIQKDPTYKLKVQGTKAAQHEDDKYVTIEQYLDLMAYFKRRSELSYIALYLIAITGARFSEVNNMTWDDLNKGFEMIHLPGTKTDTAARDVEIIQADIEHVKTQLAKRPRRIDGFLFKRSSTAVRKAMKTAQKHVGISEEDWVTIYGLRHTHCSFLLSKGVSIEYISKRLGHSNIMTTYNTYSHLLDEHRKAQGEKVRSIYRTI